MERFFYQNNISGFLADSEDTILGILARNNSFDFTAVPYIFEIVIFVLLFELALIVF